MEGGTLYPSPPHRIWKGLNGHNAEIVRFPDDVHEVVYKVGGGEAGHGEDGHILAHA